MSVAKNFQKKCETSVIREKAIGIKSFSKLDLIRCGDEKGTMAVKKY